MSASDAYPQTAVVLGARNLGAALTATVMGGRGLAPSNPLYRGWAMTALIAGILEMIATVIFFFFMTCVILLFEVGA